MTLQFNHLSYILVTSQVAVGARSPCFNERRRIPACVRVKRIGNSRIVKLHVCKEWRRVTDGASCLFAEENGFSAPCGAGKFSFYQFWAWNRRKEHGECIKRNSERFLCGLELLKFDPCNDRLPGMSPSAGPGRRRSPPGVEHAFCVFRGYNSGAAQYHIISV